VDSYQLTFVVIVSIDEIKILICYKTDCFLFLLSCKYWDCGKTQ